MRLPNPGDKKKDFFTREFYRKALEQEKPRTGIDTNLITAESSTHILGQIPSEGVNDIEPYELVSCHGVHIPINVEEDHLPRPVMKVRSYKDNVKSRFWGVATQFIDKEFAGKVQISGIAWVKTIAPVTAEEAYTHLDIVGQNTRFKLGGFPIIGVPSTPHTLIALYREAPHYVAYTTAIIPARTNDTGGSLVGSSFVGSSFVGLSSGGSSVESCFTPGHFNALLYKRSNTLLPQHCATNAPEIRCRVENLMKIPVPANSFIIAQYESGDLNIIVAECD